MTRPWSLCITFIFIVLRIAGTQECGENEVSVECVRDCTYDNCPKSADEENSCSDEPCKPGCECGFNYRRASNGTCIPTRNCPPFDCPGTNEEYNPCPPYCPDTCGRISAEGYCTNFFGVGPVLQCFPKCRCKKGYARQNGTCVAICNCESVG